MDDRALKQAPFFILSPLLCPQKSGLYLLKERRIARMKKWECLGRKKVFEARDGSTVYMELYQDRVRAPNGKEMSYTFYKASDVAIVVPFLDEERLVMIRQYRYPLGKVMLEFPAGHVEKG